MGLDPEDVDAAAKLPPTEGEGRAVERRRRYLEDCAKDGRTPKNMKEWQEAGYRANVNRDKSSVHEADVLAAVGAKPNNVAESAGGQKTHPFEEYVDDNGSGISSTKTGENFDEGAPVPKNAAIDPETGKPKTRTETTRPDGYRARDYGGTDIIEHKHMGGEDKTYNDSPQLRAQREMAKKNGGTHELLLTQDDPVPPGK